MMKRWFPVAALVAGLLPFGAAAMAAGDHGHRIEIRGGRFSPPEQTVGLGEQVTWVHSDGSTPHSVTADAGAFDSNPDCAPDRPSACLREGDTYTHAFDTLGRFPYHSRGDGGVATGVIVVVEDDGDH